MSFVNGPEVGSCWKLYCNTCKGETHHELKAVHPRENYELAYENTSNEQIAFWEKYEYRLWVCRGCETATLEEAYTHIGMDKPNGDGPLWESVLSPKRQRTELRPKHFRNLNAKLSAIYLEIIYSFNAESKILCAIGLRALLEGICSDKAVAGRDLNRKIEELKAFLPPNIVDSLHSFRFMGNVAAHELQPSQRNELQLAIEVIEDLLNFLYDLEYKAQRLPRQRSTIAQ
jgi:hypothetical protein